MRENALGNAHVPTTPLPLAPTSTEGRFAARSPVAIIYHVGIIAAALLVLALPRTPIRSTLWGILVLVAMLGWGTVLGSWLFPRRTLDWGLRAALGLAFVVALGGPLALVHLVSITSSIAVVLVGLGCLAWRGVVRTRARTGPGKLRNVMWSHRSQPSFVIATVGLALLLALSYLISVGNPVFNVYDDNIAYLAFSQQMLGSGTLIEPFSLRRIASLGGQTYLDAIVLALGAAWNLHLVDGGIAVIILAGLVQGYSRRRSRAHRLGEMIALLLVVFFTLLLIRPDNIASEFTGCVCFLGLLRVMKEEDDAGPRLGWRSASALAMLPAAAMTFRQSNLVAATVIPALGLLYFATRAPKAERRARAAQACRTTFVALSLLAPWWALSFHSCGTFLYPVFLGWGTADFALSGSIPLVDRLRYVTFCVSRQGGLFLLAGAFLMTHRSRRIVNSLLIGGGLGAMAIIWSTAPLSDASSTARYLFPIVFPCSLALCLELIPAIAIWRRSALGPWMLMARLVAVAIACVFAVPYLRAYGLNVNNMHAMKSYFISRIRMAPIALSTSRSPADVRDDLYARLQGAVPPVGPLRVLLDDPFRDDLYARLQGAVPPGARLLVLLDDPFRLDFRRNTIINFDLPGGVSPPPGIPIGRGPEELARYFSSLSIRYIAFHISGGPPLYKVAMWRRFQTQPVTWDFFGRSSQLKSMARYSVDILDNLKELSQTRRRIFEQNEYIIIDLDIVHRGKTEESGRVTAAEKTVLPQFR